MDLKVVLLGFLADRDRTGYELKKAIAKETGLFYGSPSHGAIYPALHDLEEAGLVAATRVLQRGRPDKRVYSVTGEGEAYLRARLSEAPGEDRFRSDLLLRLFFFDGIAPEGLLGWIGKRKAERCGRLRRARDALREAEQSGVPYRALCVRYEMLSCEGDLAWLEEAERGLHVRRARARPGEPQRDPPLGPGHRRANGKQQSCGGLPPS